MKRVLLVVQLLDQIEDVRMGCITQNMAAASQTLLSTGTLLEMGAD
jgi:hypothetical protein